MTGYLHPDYAKSLMEFGTPYKLRNCGGWILKRQIPGFSLFDAMSCYPLFCCSNWSQLHQDLEGLKTELITLAIVTDPFGDFEEDYLTECFADVLIPFKRHFIVDLNRPIESFVSVHHQRYSRKALQRLQVEPCHQPIQFFDDWIKLYDTLISRHRISGIAIFSPAAFHTQLNIPGVVAFRAVYHNQTVGMILWYVQDKIGYYHLGAFNEVGYQMRASFGLFWFAIEYFASHGLKWLNLGAGAGIRSNNADGLSRFKRGWSTGTATVYFGGRIFDQAKYEEISAAKGIFDSDYFPAYRKGEFN